MSLMVIIFNGTVNTVNNVYDACVIIIWYLIQIYKNILQQLSYKKMFRCKERILGNNLNAYEILNLVIQILKRLWLQLYNALF